MGQRNKYIFSTIKLNVSNENRENLYFAVLSIFTYKSSIERGRGGHEYNKFGEND